MPSLGDVPPEVLTHVAHEVWPDDIVNFALVCKAFENAASRALKRHRENMQHWNAIQVMAKNPEVVIWTDSVRAIQEDRRGCFYIRHFLVHVPRKWPYIDGKAYADDLLIWIEKEICRELKESDDLTEAMASIDFTDWCIGDKLVMIKMASLLLNLPNLKSIQWETGARTDKGVVKMHEALITFFVALSRADSRATHPKPKWLTLNPADVSCAISPNALADAMSIPSLVGIVAGVDEGYATAGLPIGTSNVRNLTFNWLPETKDQVEQILAYPKRIDNFESMWALSNKLQPFDLRSSLLRYAGDSLRFLTVRNGDTHSRVLGPLHEFKNLCYLDTDFPLFFESIPVTSEMALDLVPRSLQSLLLHEHPSLILNEAISALWDLLHEKEHACPHLVYLAVYFDAILDDYDPVVKGQVESYGYRHETGLRALCETKSIEFEAEYVEMPQDN